MKAVKFGDQNRKKKEKKKDKLEMKAVKSGDQNKKKDNKKNKRSRYFKMLLSY